MTYLISEIAIYLGAAAVIGFLTGWLAQEPRRRASASKSGAAANEKGAVAEEMSEQLEWMKERLKEQESESNETIGRMASEIEQMRPLLESLSSGMEESARDMNSDRETRERAEQAAQELEEIQQKFKQLAGEHEKLQSNYEKVADRVVEYEKERIASHKQKPAARATEVRKPKLKSVSRSIQDTASEPSPRPIPSPVSKRSPDLTRSEPLFGDLPNLERSGEPVITGVVDLDELEALQKPRDKETDASIEVEPPAMTRPEPPKPAAETVSEAGAEAGGVSGAARSLEMVPGIPADVIARMEVLGLNTNLDLLRKCATRSGLNALSMSMGLGTEALSGWVSVADLLRLECIRKNDFPALMDAGIKSVESLATSSADELSEKLRKSRKSGEAASRDTVAKWIHEARRLDEVVRD